MNGLIDAAFHHARTVLAVLVLVLIAGSYAYVQIPKESDPDISIPIVYVQMKHEGISPEDAERLLVRPMELPQKDLNVTTIKVSYINSIYIMSI